MVAGLLAVVAMLLLRPPRRSARRRLSRTARRTSPPPVRTRTGFVVTALAVAAAAVAYGGLRWVAVGAAVAAAAWVRSGGTGAASAGGAPELALVVDIVAGCLHAGAGMADALIAASAAAPPVLRDACAAVATRLTRGTAPGEAWRDWLADPALAAVARTCVRTAGSGATAAAELTRTAARLRAQQRARAQERVRGAAVWVVLPLGMCFLPAFVLVAVVPLVLGLLHTLPV